MSDFTDFFPAAGATSGGGGGGLLNTLQFKSSGTFNPSDPYGDGTRAVTAGALVHFTMIGGGYSGIIYQSQDLYRNGGIGGRIWAGTIPLTNISNTITITIGAGGVVANPVYLTNYPSQAGGASSATQTSGISINTSDSRSLAGGQGGTIAQITNTNQYHTYTAPTMALPPFSLGGYSDGNFPLVTNRGANTGDGGKGSALSGSGGNSGIVIINW